MLLVSVFLSLSLPFFLHVYMYNYLLSSPEIKQHMGRTEGRGVGMLVPVRIYALAGGALAQLLQRRGADVGQVVGARARDDGVPDDGLIRLVRAAGPLGRDVDEELLRVPGEERRKVRV